MEEFTIRNLGVSALLLEACNRRILVDAFNNVSKPIEVVAGDILLFTHDDLDHFCSDTLPVIKGLDITIVGPPSIVKPILIQEKADINQIEVLSTGNNAEPNSIKFDQINIICYHTRHFNHWDPIHNSYLIEVLGKRIYITGDSLFQKELAEIVGKTDVVICNLVEEGFLKGYEEANVAIHHTLSYLLKLRLEGMTRKIIGVHLLDADWTVDAGAMKRLIEEYDFHNIIIPTSTEQSMTI
jgi:L-ascorbate metabolism protein UlaG (beta-lactamase superfamily)